MCTSQNASSRTRSTRKLKIRFALLLKFYTRAGRFPRGRGELPDEAVEFVARQVGVDPAELGFYEWTGRTIEYHRRQIRAHLGFRECTVADAEKLTGWLAADVCEVERRPDLVHDELLVRCRTERIEPPAARRVDRVVRSALPGRAGADRPHCGPAARRRRRPAARPGCGRRSDDNTGEDSVLGLIKSVPGNVSLDSMLTEIRKLQVLPGRTPPLLDRTDDGDAGVPATPARSTSRLAGRESSHTAGPCTRLGNEGFRDGPPPVDDC
jgi:hypothetical protein